MPPLRAPPLAFAAASVALSTLRVLPRQGRALGGAAAAAVVLSLAGGGVALAAAADNKPAWEAPARKAIAGIIAKDENMGPTLVRLAWHSAGTYSKVRRGWQGRAVPPAARAAPVGRPPTPPPPRPLPHSG